MYLDGVISGFCSHKPSDYELETCRRVELSADTPWNPNDPMFTQQERAVASKVSGVHRNGDEVEGTSKAGDATAGASDEAKLALAGGDSALAGGDSICFDVIPEPPELLDERELGDRLVAAVNVASDDWNGDGFDGYGDEELFQVPKSGVRFRRCRRKTGVR